MSYKLKLQMFEGPLDLLLYLIRKEQINIYDIPIAEVTEQYMQYIEMLKLLDLETIGEFLVMAATLVQIKSKMLLPPDPNASQEEEPEDPREELVRRLLEYKKFKEIARDLQSRESHRQDLFARPSDEDMKRELKEESKEVYFEASLFDLITAFTKVLKTVPREVFYQVVKEEYTVEEKIHDILHLLLEKSQVHLNELFAKAKSKLEIIVIFMSILELIRLKEIIVLQKRAFDEIIVMRNRENIIPVETEKTEGQVEE